MDNQEKNNQVDKKNENLEIIKSIDNENAVILTKEKLDVKKNGNIIIGTMNVFINPLKKRHEEHYKNSLFHLWADIILGLIILCLVVALIFILFLHPEEDIMLQSKYLSEKIVSGQEETFELLYSHNGDKEISEVAIAVHLPKYFILKEVYPKDIFNSNTNTFNLGDLSKGGNGKIKIIGTVYGEISSKQAIFYTFNYIQGGKQLSKLNSLNYNIENSSLKTDIEIPTEIYKGVVFDTVVKITNNSLKDINNISLKITDNWQIKQANCSTEKVELNNNHLLIKKIEAGDSIQINVSILTSLPEGDNLVGLISFIDWQNESLKQEELIKNIKIIEPKFKIDLKPEKNSVNFGEKIVYKMNLANNENVEINNIKINLDSGNQNFYLANNTIVSNINNCQYKNGVFNLQKILPGEKGELVFAVDYSRIKQGKNQEIFLTTHITYTINNQNLSYDVQSGKTKILSNLQIKSSGYYYSPQGDQLGAGPLPPMVDTPTNYWIFWEVKNYGNKLSNIIFSAELPENVYWVNNKSLLAGELYYGEIGKNIVWKINSLDDETSDNITSKFEISLVPTKNDLNKILNLLTNVKIKAYDNFSSEYIEFNIENNNTDLKNDILAQNKARVKKLD